MADLIIAARPADLEHHTQLAVLPVAPPRITGSPRNILLTGATGFLGAFLLAELVTRTNAHLHCLVRSRSETHGRERIASALEEYELPAVDPGRVKIITGDLATPRLGVSDPQWRALAGQIDTIVHNGAYVHWVKPLEDLYPANVDGTRTIIALAAEAGARLHHISSIAVFPYGADRCHAEDDPLTHDDTLIGGYAHSKWIAERLVEKAADEGLRVTVYRPGTLSGSSSTGLFSAACITDRMLKSAIELGVTPELGHHFDVTPVDFAACATAHLVAARTNGAFHLTNPNPMPTKMLRAVLARRGYQVKDLPFDAWKQHIFGQALGNADAMRPFRSFLDATSALQLGIPHYQTDNADAALQGTDITCPPVDSQLINTYLDRYEASGWITRKPEESQDLDDKEWEPEHA